MEVHVSRCREDQLPAAADLFDQYRQFYGMPADYEGAYRFLRERMLQGESVLLVAHGADDQLTGFTQLYPMFSSTRLARLWVLNDLFVAPEARRLGVGRRLMDAARAAAGQDGVKILALATEKTNFGAKALYEQLGYELDRTYDHYELTL